MRNRVVRYLTVAFVLLLSACASKPSATATNEAAPSGKWAGEYGMGTDRREPINVDLHWEDTNLRGVVRAGARSLPLTKASFKPETGAISMEFDAEGNGGRTVHYIIDGKVSGDTMSGTWTHDDQSGDFQVKKQ